MKIRSMFSWVAVLGFCLAPAALAQTGTSSAPTSAGAPNKIAVMESQTVVMDTAEGKTRFAELQSQFAPRQAEIDKTQKDIEAIEKKAATQVNALSDEEKSRMGREHDMLLKKLSLQKEEANDEYSAASQEIFESIGTRVVALANRYAQENGIGIMFDTSGQTSPVLYRAQQLDITQEIVKLYDQQYPVKAGAAAPAQKPASPPAQAPAKKPGGGPGHQL